MLSWSMDWLGSGSGMSSSVSRDVDDSSPVSSAHAQTLTYKLQGLLDQQWDGLSTVADPPIGVVRAEIEDTMAELLRTQQSLEDDYDERLSRQKQKLETANSNAQKVEKLRAQITQIESESPLVKEAASLQTEQIQLRDEIAQVEAKLHSLRMRHATVSQRLLYINSTVESRASSFRHELADLDRSKDPPVGDIEHHVDALQTRVNSAHSEAQALQDGLVVWRDVRQEVGDLEAKLATSLGNLGPQALAGMVEASISRIDQKLTLAQSSNWSLLVVALTHELEALKKALAVLKQHDQDKPSD